MKIEVGEHGVIELREVYNPIKLVSSSGKDLVICMRDGDFELMSEGRRKVIKDL